MCCWLEKVMAPHSSTLAWKIPWTEEPGGLQSVGSQSRTLLSDFTFTFHFHALEKEMATHCSVLAWRIPGTGEPGGLPSMGLRRVGHDRSDLAAAAAVAVISLSAVSNPATPCTVASQTPLSMGILQARILDLVAMPSFRGSPQSNNQVSHIAGRFFTVWATRETEEYWSG